ncbi:MAG: 30S ribosomal protein S6e [Candidatus Aenigmarchaeota archaeon]|nr:30S ribosomal protein S6e [Candidatus Aenigmarchaeota archaeon]
MADFKVVVSDPKTRRSYSVIVDQDKAAGIVGKRIGENFNGDILGLSSYELQITGGTDKDGFPMIPSVHGPVKKKTVLSHPPGFNPKIKGQRKRMMIRGNTISRDITQINTKVIKEGNKPLEELLGKKGGDEPKPKQGE